MIPEMGRMGKDKVTGFVGTVTGRSEYINGCVHLMLEAKAKPGMKPIHAWFDEDRCVTLTSPKRRKAVKKSGRYGSGGPMPHSA
ncbi:hypothetical protein LCGC14_1797020 [marine sediment metagenome]|uniref:Uncharacterized protein n=1 Tax=marine sediment metagenome TaxID=412755 RepID=A0A0F9GQV8_9ZZZZ